MGIGILTILLHFCGFDFLRAKVISLHGYNPPKLESAMIYPSITDITDAQILEFAPSLFGSDHEEKMTFGERQKILTAEFAKLGIDMVDYMGIDGYAVLSEDDGVYVSMFHCGTCGQAVAMLMRLKGVQ